MLNPVILDPNVKKGSHFLKNFSTCGFLFHFHCNGKKSITHRKSDFKNKSAVLIESWMSRCVLCAHSRKNPSIILHFGNDAN